MSFKNLVKDFKDMRDNLGSMSRRTFDVKFSHCSSRVRSQRSDLDVPVSVDTNDSVESSCWGSLPPELLRDVLRRVESAEGSWPARKDVVACSAVCRTWREITKELVKTPEESGKLTFPISLKQPGPRDGQMHCFIERDRTSSTYYLYLGPSPSLVMENKKFLLAARRVRKATSTDYLISLNADDVSRGSNNYIGKLRSNFLGTKFTIHDTQAPVDGTPLSTSRAFKRISSKKVSPKVPACSYNIAHIAYELNVLGTRGPRRMICTVHSIPALCMELGSSAPTPTEFTSCTEDSVLTLPNTKSASEFFNEGCESSNTVNISDIKNVAPLVLKNKAPRWHEQLQCWCLNFKGRVTVASVKNFQLVAALDPGPTLPQAELDKVILQFGKIGKDIFTMDYRYPLSAFQAFAICLSSFDTKLACE
ncbi:hypothetical protein KP509_21G026300 [Ceratopteris richardii]|uniref:Tubby-like F-box protein n=1 Tax=Ceratopteris richardii TaxID=49495 RepID=A0A8T2S8K1_CERRI|nr:hypothetical protein KP509_21G026300 [Ceratopteris richardii]KAH7314899.1 hypothetical protein KP509_21G026300 [Ceratopteris richardii]KAH7314900.1 hypothetical protein KP509_21G026300 [Ceratopteris richardii]